MDITKILLYFNLANSIFDCKSNNETVYPIWNTTAGSDSTLATNGTGVGNYFPGELAPYACDSNMTSKYTNFGSCILSANQITCGSNTGFYRTSGKGPSLITGFQICTENNNPPRDPTVITLEGSNQSASVLHLGSSWNLIYNGPSGLATDPGRRNCGTVQSFANNSISYTSYRFLAVSKRGNGSCASYSEVKLFRG